MRKITLVAYCIVIMLMSIVVINNLDPWRPSQPKVTEGTYSPLNVQKNK